MRAKERRGDIAPLDQVVIARAEKNSREHTKMNESELMQSGQYKTLRGAMILKMQMAGTLNDEFLPPPEFMMATRQLPRNWTPELREKLMPYAAPLINADLKAASQP